MSLRLLSFAVAIGFVALTASVAGAADWQPSLDGTVPRYKLNAAFPKEARETGGVALDCVAAKDGRLVDCKVARELPAGQGFGDAAIKAAMFMRMSPWTREGDTLEGLKVTLPFDFTLPDATAAPPAKP